MAANPERRYTLEEYFELERTSEERFEFRNGEVFCTSGASNLTSGISGVRPLNDYERSAVVRVCCRAFVRRVVVFDKSLHRRVIYGLFAVLI